MLTVKDPGFVGGLTVGPFSRKKSEQGTRSAERRGKRGQEIDVFLPSSYRRDSTSFPKLLRKVGHDFRRVLMLIGSTLDELTRFGLLVKSKEACSS